MDWFNEAFGSIPYCLILLTTGSLYVGMYLYINGMADDLQETLQQLAEAKQEHMWPTYVDEIRFHNEIIEYDNSKKSETFGPIQMDS